jgi:hypothetical protein
MFFIANHANVQSAAENASATCPKLEGAFGGNLNMTFEDCFNSSSVLVAHLILLAIWRLA